MKYTPVPDSLAARVLKWLREHPTEELTGRDISIKFGCGTSGVHTQLQGLLANASQADAYKLVLLDESVGFEPYGLILRKNDPEFKKLVDDVLVGLFRSGEIERIYARWFLSAIPPKGINLNAPMSPELKQLIKTPNDRGI